MTVVIETAQASPGARGDGRGRQQPQGRWAPGHGSSTFAGAFECAGASCYGGRSLAPVAQLDRVSVFETEGWEFKPLRARQ
jgi:hypothetical protein